MNDNPHMPKQDEPHQGEAACGARITITPHTPAASYRGELVHFCGEECRELFSDDPLNSCLASRLLAGK